MRIRTLFAWLCSCFVLDTAAVHSEASGLMRTGTETIQSLTADTPLFETEANALSAGRVWLRRTSVGYLCIGLGPSAALTRFAFEDVADAHPFYKAWRRLDRDVARDGSEKARRLGLRIPFGALADPALRRLAIASALLKAGFDPNQSRDDGGHLEPRAPRLAE